MEVHGPRMRRRYGLESEPAWPPAKQGGGFRIRSGRAMWVAAVHSCLWLVIVVMLPFDYLPRWSQDPWIVFLGCVLAFGLFRAFSMRLDIDTTGVVVRGWWRTRRLRWSDLEKVCCSWAYGYFTTQVAFLEKGRAWPTGSKASIFAGRKKERHRLVSVLQEYAKPHGLPVDLGLNKNGTWRRAQTPEEEAVGQLAEELEGAGDPRLGQRTNANN